MGSKSKKEKAKKRKLDEEPKKLEVSAPKKKFEQEKQVPRSSNEEHIAIIPTRQAIADVITISVRQKAFTLIEGPIGSGKSFLGAYVANKLGLQLMCMQMGDQVDSKSIFGSYHCTEVAGQFRWNKSNFTQWLVEPTLILLEDIDLANSDAISIFIEIANCRRVTLPSGEVIPFHEKARFLATTSGKGKKNTILDGVAVRVKLDALTDKELERLVLQSYPRCATFAKTLRTIFRDIEAVPVTANSRSLTSSDFLRGCARLNNMVDLSSNIDIFSELIDCWCLSELPERARLLCSKVAAKLSITPDQLEFHLGLRQPSFSYDDYSCIIGRCKLSRSPSLKVVQYHKLGHTRDVLQLMERIAICVKENESVLLVGETGVGKTSIIQTLASTLNISLKVVNLSPTSDTDELLEGYKPTTIGNMMEPFTKFYYEVFTDNLDANQNRKFLDSLEACLNSGRYRDYLSLTEKTALKVMAGKAEVDPRWAEVIVRARKIRNGIDKNAVPFAIAKGAVLEAVQNGYWLLVDEINLAPPECLDAIVHAISSLAHPNFRLFACMNPATDAGKRRLPASVRTRFTEFYVSETNDPYQLALVVNAYLPTMKSGSVENLVQFYLQAKKDFPSSYSLRTLCRSLLIAADNMFGSEDRSIFEAVSMAFLTNLDSEDKLKMKQKINRAFKVETSIPIPPPSFNKSKQYIKIENYWVECGTLLPKADDAYVLTKTVKENLSEIARIVSNGRFPVLLEGETSAGKTAIVTYLGKITGNEVIRINNHEHTDIQEYIGSYVAGDEGRLVFSEGALVKAVKNGSWVILDELNLAPTDVIESLNRLLDDNRELFIPELNKAIKAHPQFRLFATQNPAGTYSGRKKLSRALLSRFIVLKFHHLPMDELSQMVCTRCKVPPSAANKMIEVLTELRNRRSLSGLFSARDGLMTLRDVFRWAKRLHEDDLCDDWLQVLVDHGYFLLAGRCRNKKDETTVSETLEKILKRKINPETLFAMCSRYFPKAINIDKIVLTYGMRRMLVLTEQAWKHKEAVLMIGETGGGKTTLAEAMGQGLLLTINCHERTETADLLGRLRPRDEGGFEWTDGVVVSAMKSGVPLLIDEISLAEDSVLERLNPLFEEDRSLLVSDAGVEAHCVKANENFQLIATMNPGGDYGKKELSKALRNRFTEVWSSSEYKPHELVDIFDNRLVNFDSTKELPKPTRAGKAVISWISEFFEKYAHVFRHAPSVRDIVASGDLFGSMVSNGFSENSAVKEALSAVFLDALESLPTRMSIDIEEILTDADRILNRLLATTEEFHSKKHIQLHEDRLSVGWISVPFGSITPSTPKAFSLKAPTSISNFYRIARGLLINKPILLEGPPGCGKSSTVMALAQLTGNPITRLNLSDQTDLSDLFGSDVPVVLEDGSISFQWEDGPVLRAIKRGEWILLDEMNLASQSVLEGLNACFDHRRVLYIAELNKSFEIPPDSHCRFFACQNPRAQGGHRRALPKSFVNRFTTIWVNDLTKHDIFFILQEVDERKILTHTQVHAMVEITFRLSQEHHFQGGPFSFNLRDLLRWLQLYYESNNMCSAFHTLFVSRMRKDEDRIRLCELYREIFQEPCVAPPTSIFADKDKVMIGTIALPRRPIATSKNNALLVSQMSVLEKLATCVKMKWLSLIVGPRGCGKHTVIENLAEICGIKLEKITLTPETDAQELIGSYEQTAVERAKAVIIESLLGKVDSDTMERLRLAEDLLDLEIATELALCQVRNKPSLIEDCRQALNFASRTDMRFTWIDSAFVRAFVEGHWLIIENVNLCSAAVLDRLNSCLENDGKLVISERQASFEPLEPHERFRVFLIMDPKDGEISRAMRNRSVEIYVTDSWNTVESDCATLAYLSGRQLPKQAIVRLPIETQLHFFVLIREMEVEQACRALNIQFYSDCRSQQPIILSPTISDLITDKYTEWVLKQWRLQDESLINGFLWCCLSSSKKLPKHPLFTEFFGAKGSRFMEKFEQLFKSMPESSIPIDMRFLGCHNADDRSLQIFKRLVSLSVEEWALFTIDSIKCEVDSAEHLNELSTNPKSFKNLPLISGLADAVINTFVEGTISGSENHVFLFSMSLVLLMKNLRKTLADRSGCAPIYLAWNYIDNINSVEVGTLLLKVIEIMKTGWSAEAYEQFVTKYMVLYENYRLVNAFETEDQCYKLKRIVDPQVAECEPMEIEAMGERMESTILESLQLVRRVELVLSSLKSSQIDENNCIFASLKPLLVMSWTTEYYEKFSRTLNLLNCSIDDSSKILSLPDKGTFAFIYGSFWKSFDFDVNMSSLLVQDLQNMTLVAFIEKMWRLAANGELLDNSISADLISIPTALENWCTTETQGWEGWIEVAVQMMTMAIPPKETIDPIIYEEEKVRYLSMKLDMVDKQLEILRQWRQGIAKQDGECDLNSLHPVISTLFASRIKLLEELDHCFSSELPVYRQNANMYTSLCGEIRSFHTIAEEVSNHLRRLNLEQLSNIDQVRLYDAQLRSFVISVASFKKNLLANFTSFVDIYMPFLTAVEILLLAVHEVSSKLEIIDKLQELKLTSAFPVHYQLKNSMNGAVSSELLAWACRDGSPMPLRLKSVVIRRRLLEKIDPIVDLEWTRREWKKWYERNVAKSAEKEYVYRDKCEEEKEELDIREFFAEMIQEKQILSADDICLLLNNEECLNEARIYDVREADARYSMALVWIRHLLTTVHRLEQDYRKSSISSDLQLINWVAERERRPVDNIFDVYRSASIEEFRKAGKMLATLVEKTKQVLERWPEVVTLKLILTATDVFLKAPITTSHARMSVLLENVLEQCEEWEKLSDRSNSLREQLIPLRELLVHWKKLEIKSWSHLLSRTENDSFLSAQLVAFPLFDALFSAETKDAAINLIAMSAEWLHNGTLLDFSARLDSIKTLADWSLMLEKPLLATKLHSLARHFKQYLPIVQKTFNEQRSIAEQNLNDFIKIVKYNDLNLWNIKAQAQKAHAHLFKIIKKFKANTTCEASVHFDELLDIEKWTALETISPNVDVDLLENTQKRIHKAHELGTSIVYKAHEICNLNKITDLAAQVGQCDESLRTTINYDEYEEDEAKEKAQGYARNCRQRDVAMIIKEAQVLGLNARRAVTLNQEKITQDSITGIAKNSELEGLIRACAGGRNMCIKKANNVSNQVGIATRKHFTGIIEFGMSWILKLHCRVSKSTSYTILLNQFIQALQTMDSNNEDSWIVDHEQLRHKICVAHNFSQNLLDIAEGIKSRMDLVPQTNDIEESLASNLHPLSLLYAGHPEIEQLSRNINDAFELAKSVNNLLKQLCESFVLGVVSRFDIIEIMNKLNLKLTDLQGFIDILEKWFSDEKLQLDKLIQKIRAQMEYTLIEAKVEEISIEPGLLFIQHFYKTIVSKEDWDDIKLIDQFELLSQIMDSADTSKITTWLGDLISKMKVGIFPQNLQEIIVLTKVVVQLSTLLHSNICRALQSVSILYYSILSVTSQLFEKGYVNTIPKEGKHKSGDGKNDETGEGGGMGEGKAGGSAKDVTDEMEETGQIEGLQNEEQEPPSGQSGENEKPIEMDEDFAEDLQDIDKNEKNADEPEENDDDEEQPEPEDQMGDVDDADDNQLDPKLWDEDEKDDQRKETDQDDTGADNKTDQMAAKEDDPLAAQQQKEPENDTPSDEEKDIDKLDDDMENVDERDREDVNETPHPEISNDEIDQNDEDGKIDEEMPIDDDNDKEDDEEPVEGTADEESDIPEEVEKAEDHEDIRDNPFEENEVPPKEDSDAMEQGTGGQRTDRDTEKSEGGRNEDEEEDEERMDNDGKGESKSDQRGEEGQGVEEKEERMNGEQDEDAEEQAQKERQLASEDDEMVDAEEGKGEQNEAGQTMEDSATSKQQMKGGGSLEEAKKSKREEKRQNNLPKKRKPRLGGDETMDVPAEDEINAQNQDKAAIHLAPEDMFKLAEELTNDLVLGEMEKSEVENEPDVELRQQNRISRVDAEKMWTEISRTVNILSAELAENLRLILEPQRASKMQGDYRTGKRLNMRRLIPYIASEYRKDRIWMRRTKKAQRDYQVLIAVDDSASMNENGIHQVTCESVCSIDDALRRCDAGATAVVSFGSTVKTICAFGDQISPGPEFIEKLSFDQASTDLVALLNKSRTLLADVRTPTSEQLLIIISDGRGALSQGADKVKQALASLQSVTVLFVILDSGPKSISELSVASFKGGSVVLTPYLSLFPFPFYAVIKTVQQLPSVLAESIRQWFELSVQSL